MAATVNKMETWEGNLASLGRPAFDMLAAGGKAASLHRIKAAGFPVPAGFVVTPDTALDQPGELKDAVSSIGGYPVAVRSSAVLEDLAGATFAGQYSTHLSITDPEGLVTAIAECRASQHTQHVVSYLKKNGCEHGRARISVLVQKMVDAAAAGVAFSIHPHTGREEHALIECCHGLGDRLVSGTTTPTQYTMRLEDAFVLEHRAGNEDVVLPDETLHRLCRYALELQAFFGMPQDIEWAMDRSGELWILQSRPITRIHWRCEADDFTNANFRDGGVGARVITPLMYSLYGAALQSALQQYFVAVKTVPHDAPQAWISKFYGRPYWNASAVKRALSKVPGYDEERFDRDLGIQKDYGDSGPIRTPLNLRTLLVGVPVAIALQKEFRRQLRLAGEYRQNFLPKEAQYLRLADGCAAMTDGEFFLLLLEVLDFHKQTERDYLRTVVNHVNYQAEFNKLLARIQAATGEAMKPVVLMSGLQDVSHMTIQSDFVKLVHTAKVHGSDSAEWDSALADFLSANFFHGDAELDISAPRWRERPERIKETVDSVLRSKIEPKDVELTAYQQFLKYSEEVFRVTALLQRTLLNRLRFEKAFRERLQIARTYALRREELREYAMRADNLVRRYTLEAGRRLCEQGWIRQEEDAFMLSAEELRGIVERRENRPRILAVTDVRRLMHRGYALVQPPGELGRAILHRDPTCDAPAVSVDNLLKGNGCSAGVVTGRARVVTELAACNALQPNEVLVTRFIDPSWTPVIGLVSGLVAEVGGLLSHGAVIAREYGLPAVLDVRGATSVIKTGQMVEIDGTRGTVRILSTESAASTAAGSRNTGNPACAAPLSPPGNAEVNLP